MSVCVSDDGNKFTLHLRGLKIDILEDEAEQIISYLTHTLNARYEASASRNMMCIVNGCYQMKRIQNETYRVN